MTRRAKSLNIRALVVVLLVTGLALITVVFVHRFQVARNSGGLARLARSKLAEGKSQESIGLFSRYLSYNPHDAVAQAELARLMIEFAERPSASKDDRGYAYRVLETAVRNNPDDLSLRRHLATWMLRFGRFGDAERELTLLREQLLAAPPANNAADAPEQDAPDLDSVEVMRARSVAGQGKFREAAEIVAAVLGFDLATRSFIEQSTENTAGKTVREASSVLATLLSEKLGSRAAAESVLTRLVESNPDDAESWLVLARWHQRNGDLVRAAKAVRAAAKLSPEGPDVLFTDLELSVAEGRFDAATQLAEKALSLFPDDERGYRGIATIAIRQQNPERAIDVLRRGLEKLPQQPSLLQMLGESLLQAKRFAEAEQTVDALVNAQGDGRPAVGMLQARLLMAQKRWLPARLKLEAVRPLVAESDEMTRQIDLLLGQCHEMLGQFDEQLAANQRVLLGDFDSLQARAGVASALASSGKPEEALAEYERIAASLPEDRLAMVPPVWNPLLQLRISSQLRRPQADRDWSLVEKLLDLLERSPVISDAQVALLKSDVLVRRGDPGAALNVLQKAVDTDPGNTQARAALALLVLREQGFSAAQEMLSKMPAKIADDPLILTVRAQMASRAPADKSAAMLSQLETKAGDLPPDQTIKILSTIAAVRRSLGDRKEADRVWRRALELSPDDILIRTALFELACERGDIEEAQACADAIGRLSGPTSPQSRAANAATLILEVRASQAAKSASRTADDPGLSTEQQSRLDAARNLLIEAENDRPGWSQIQQLFAEIARLRGDLPAAIERLQQATRLGPANPEVMRQLVLLLYQCDRMEEARQTLAMVGPDGLNGLERLSAEIDLKNGQFDDAVAMAERALAGNRKNTAGDLFWFGQLLARAGKTARAIEVLDQAVDADSPSPEAWMALLLVQRAAGRMQDAERTMERAGRSLAAPQRQIFLAQAQEVFGRIDDAERLFREAIVASPAKSAPSRNLTSFLVRHGRLADAREELAKMIAVPDQDSVTRINRIWARRMLAELTAQSGRYSDMERALALLDANADGGGVLPPEDLALQAALLASRPEPSSWQRSIGVFDKLAAQQPLSTAQRTAKARLLDQLGRWDECRNELLTIASAPNTPPTFHALLIEKLLEHRELEAATIWLKTLADRLPEAPIVAALQAKVAIAHNDRETAVAAARKLMPDDKTYPAISEQLRTVSALLEDLGLNAAADRVFSQFASVSSDGVIARAGFLGRAQRADEALDLIEQAWTQLPLEKTLQTALAVLGSQDMKTTPQQLERVGRWFEKARREDPDSPALELLFANFVGMTGTTQDAVEAYRKVLALEDLPPQQAALAANNLAFYLAEPATAAEARALVDRAFAELGPHPDVLDTRGVVMLAEGRGKEALADLQEAVLVPTGPKYLHLAAALASLDQTEAARKAFAKAKDLGLVPQRLSAGELHQFETLESELAR